VIDETLLEAEEKMEKAVEVAKEDFGALRTGRANPAMFSKLLVDYYGAPTPLQQLASFQTPEARTVLHFDRSNWQGEGRLLNPHDANSLRLRRKSHTPRALLANRSIVMDKQAPATSHRPPDPVQRQNTG